jgi:TolB-like protein/Tfp pilus assembly protein PilF
MADNPTNFWQELKRRRVIRVIIIYAAAAYVILELISIIAEPFGLPEWTLKLVFVLLCVGLVISIILSWVYDITPEGVQKTKPAGKESEPKVEKSSNNIGWKIVTYISIIIISGLLMINIFSREKKSEGLEKSFAVLPFENLSSDEENAWFSDGITDVIINQLSKISSYRVIGRMSTLKYKEEKKSIPEIGEELGVNYIIEGTVQRQENEMRISVQLVRVLNEDHIWSDLYDRDLKDIFNVQTDIAERIAEELKTALTQEEIERVEKEYTEIPEAYNLYLQGRFFWGTRTKEGLNKSIECFNKALELDPDYALAYVGLADTYFIQGWWGWIPLNTGFALAEENVFKALAIDKNLAEAHTVMGALYTWKYWDWEKARNELELAIELNPNFGTAHQYYSELLDIMGENKRAREEIDRAIEIDPFLPVLRALSGSYYYNEGRLENSFDEFDNILELDPKYGSGSAHWFKFFIHIRKKEDLKAVEEIKKALEVNPSTATEAEKIDSLYSNVGINGVISLLIELKLQDSVPSPYRLARLYLMLDQKEEALACLEKGMEDKYNRIPYIYNELDFLELRSDPRFREMIKKLGLSEYAKVK